MRRCFNPCSRADAARAESTECGSSSQPRRAGASTLQNTGAFAAHEFVCYGFDDGMAASIGLGISGLRAAPGRFILLEFISLPCPPLFERWRARPGIGADSGAR